ncbi:hypothetical protein A2U01_0080951, partial [Trifolium medium]|nr:hypothetical protein [Trifolium medium]
MTGNNSGGNTIVNSHTDESMKTVSENLDHEKSAKKDKEADLNVVDLDDFTSAERNVEKTPES